MLRISEIGGDHRFSGRVISKRSKRSSASFALGAGVSADEPQRLVPHGGASSLFETIPPEPAPWSTGVRVGSCGDADHPALSVSWPLAAEAAASEPQISFAPSVTYSCPACGHLTQVAAGNFTGSGRPDLVAVAGVSEVDVFHNNGDGTFSGPTLLATGGATGGVAVGDFTGDGKLDIVVTIPSANEVQVFPGNATEPLGSRSPRPSRLGAIRRARLPLVISITTERPT